MIEQQIERTMFSQDQEKTFIDKILAKDEVKEIRRIMKKSPLSREDLNELLNLISSNEQKLLNLGVWDRYVNLKSFVWVRETVKVTELLYDYKDDLEKKENFCKNCRLPIKSEEKSCTCSKDINDVKKNIMTTQINNQIEVMNEKYKLNLEKKELIKVQIKKVYLSDRARQLFENVFRQMEHNVKFIVDLYLNICRTTLSLGGTGILEILRNKYEISYPNSPGLESNIKQEKTSWWKR